MRRIAISTLAFLLTGGGAWAEDFSGFYAGINAGYATGRERDRTVATPAPGSAVVPGRGRADGALPPSAADAAAAMKGSGRTGPRSFEGR